MKTNLRFICFLAIAFLVFSVVTTAQESIVLDGRSFVKVDSAWHVEYLGDRFKVDESSITVKWKAGVDSADIDTFLTKIGAVLVRRDILGYVDLRIPRSGDFIPILRRFIESELVESAEANSFGKWGTSYPPPLYSNDSYRANQWYLNQANNVDINANEAWAYSTGSPSVIVSDIGNGVDWLHEDIGKGTDSYQNIWLNPGEDVWSNPNDPTTGNHIDEDGDGYIDDWKGWNFYAGTNNSIGASNTHGTAVAGNMAAKTNNSKGIAGIAGGWNGPGVKMIPVVAGNAQGPVTELIDDAILYAVAHGAKVINMSFLVPSGSAIDAALEYAYNNGCVLVACSGNGPDTNTNWAVWYPANNPHVIAVSGITKQGNRYPSGSTPSGTVSLSAPAGTDQYHAPDSLLIYTTSPGNQYHYYQGTSVASPQAAAVAALLLSVRPTLSPSQIRCILEQTATDMGATGYDQYFGWGRLNAYRALQAAVILLIAPANNSILLSLTPSLSWTQLYGATSFRVQVATDTNFVNPVFDQFGITVTVVSVGNLSPHRDYYWRVKADNDLCNVAAWTTRWKFTTPQDTGRPDPTKIGVSQAHQKPVPYQLGQNYPNPFNPTTVIRYQLSVQSHVTLKVYNTLGQEVATLVDELMEEGKHEVALDASRWSSGIYTYRLTAGTFLAVKKMLLVR